MATVIIKLRDGLKKWEGITVHDKDWKEVTLLKGSKVERVECNESDAKSYAANYGTLLEIVTPEDLTKQVETITSFLKKKFPKEFGKGDEPEDEDPDEDESTEDDKETGEGDKTPEGDETGWDKETDATGDAPAGKTPKTEKAAASKTDEKK